MIPEEDEASRMRTKMLLEYALAMDSGDRARVESYRNLARGGRGYFATALVFLHLRFETGHMADGLRQLRAERKEQVFV